MGAINLHPLILSVAVCVLRLSAADTVTDVPAKAGWDDLPPITADAATEWPWWRGVTRDGHAAPGQDPVTAWGEQSNVLWKTPLDGVGHGTPCIRAGRMYLAAGDRKAGTIWVAAFDQADGKKLWQTEVYQGAMPKAHKDNSPASATIACDGERLFFPFQAEKEVRMVALDLEGKVLWQFNYGPYQTVQGHSASAALYHSAVLLAVDGKENKQITALHRKTGELVWRHTRKADGESYASPVVATIAGRDQVVVAGPTRTRSHDPMTGLPLWDCDGPAPTCASTPSFSADHVFVCGGYPKRSLLAIRADGSGDVTATHLAWKDGEKDKKAGYIPSTLHHDGLLYEMIDSGLFRCYDAVKGTVVWEHDTKAPFYSSPVLVGNRIFIFDQKGKGWIFSAGRTGKLETVNDLPSGAYATPVFLGSRMYLRTLNALYCFGRS